VMNRRLETERNRADKAYQFAKEGIEKHRDEYITLVRKLAMQILNNGLGETIAFHFSKSKNKYGEQTANGYVCDQLRQWLLGKHSVDSTDIAAFVHRIVSLPVADFRAATNETIAFLNWLRRFTDGLAAQQVFLKANSDTNESENQG
jgi:CRISPR-associated protein Cmr5